jgi:hypothetical protein
MYGRIDSPTYSGSFEFRGHTFYCEGKLDPQEGAYDVELFIDPNHGEDVTGLFQDLYYKDGDSYYSAYDKLMQLACGAIEDSMD